MAAPNIPSATYRLQFNRDDLRFEKARSLVPYLHALGITDLYASPLFEARRGSAHGYDITNPARLNPELGSEEDFTALTRNLRQNSMGLLLDVVPSHMAASSENPWWRDVLRNGPDSAYAKFFDIDWQPARPGLAGKVLLPVLGEHYGKVLENRELILVPEEDGFWVRYHEQRLPLSPAASGWLLAHCLGDTGGRKNFALFFRRAWTDFWRRYNSSPGVKARVDQKLHCLNGNQGDPQSFNRLDQLLAEQAYRPAFWRTANEEINYRRFFAVSDLVSLHMEQAEVFAACHSLIFRLARAGQVTGLRVDHIDGLHDPQDYLCRLREHLPGAERDREPGFYVVAEKILGEGETLPAAWPVYGTTGYDFMNTLNGLFVDGRGIRELDRFYGSLTGLDKDFATIVYTQKKKVLAELFAGDMRRLARRLGRLAEDDRCGRDLTLSELETALIEVTSCLGIYRTYIRDYAVTEPDRNFIARAVAEAGQRNPGCRPACDFLRRVLLLEFPGYLPEKQRRAWLDLVMRWQQFSGPAMAKGFEDTTLYLYHRLISLNEVGGNPASPGLPPAEFHRRNRSRQEHSPHSISATSTHDTKRSEDVRARINVLSELPGVWAQKVEQWRRWNRPKKRFAGGRPVPGANLEYFIYQTLTGAWPLHEEEVPAFRERLRAYLIKAAREAKTRTGWLRPDAAYEDALEHFTTSILEPEDGNVFLRDFTAFQKEISGYGALNSLSQVLLKITSPGVPDFYQGTELWNFSLVDPDNRRPVDFRQRAGMLTGLKKAAVADGPPALVKNLLAHWQDGRVKLYLTYKALNFRRKHRELFAAGEYLPLEAGGPAREHVCAFTRRRGGDWVLAAVPRLAARLRLAAGTPRAAGGLPICNLVPEKTVWAESTLILPQQAPDRWRCVLTGEIITATNRALPLTRVFQNFPVALLTKM